MTNFSLSNEQEIQIQEWLTNTVYPAVVAKQREEIKEPGEFITYCWDMGYPYDGASGGGLTYEFTPTSIGTVEKVRYGEHELDVTDYRNW